ncbi:ribosomal protein S7 domain-containing protein [Cladochytrium replicatum]|nr:ribosomal protein S7 domain-containing protein [Cladochytrium replicatum]
MQFPETRAIAALLKPRVWAGAALQKITPATCGTLAVQARCTFMRPQNNPKSLFPLRTYSTTTAPLSSAPRGTITLQSVAPNSAYDDLIEQVVNNIMKHGRKALARRLISDALKYVLQETGEDPRRILEEAIERAAPLVKIVSHKKGAKAIQTPRPLFSRQRRRTAILWILDAAKAKGGKTPFGARLGKELIAVMKGESSVLAKKHQLHKIALANRSNIVMPLPPGVRPRRRY